MHGEKHVLGLIRMPIMATGQRQKETDLVLLWLIHPSKKRLKSQLGFLLHRFIIGRLKSCFCNEVLTNFIEARVQNLKLFCYTRNNLLVWCSCFIRLILAEIAELRDCLADRECDLRQLVQSFHPQVLQIVNDLRRSSLAFVQEHLITARPDIDLRTKSIDFHDLEKGFNLFAESLLVHVDYVV